MAWTTSVIEQTLPIHVLESGAVKFSLLSHAGSSNRLEGKYRMQFLCEDPCQFVEGRQ